MVVSKHLLSLFCNINNYEGIKRERERGGELRSEKKKQSTERGLNGFR